MVFKSRVALEAIEGLAGTESLGSAATVEKLYAKIGEFLLEQDFYGMPRLG